MRRLLILSLCSLGLASCRKAGGAVLARVGGSVITEDEFRRKLSDVSPQYQNYVLSPFGQKQFLDVLIREKLILEGARAAGTLRKPDYQEKMRALKKEEDEKLAEAGEYLLTRLWFDDLRAQGVLQISDDEVRDYHRKHPEELQVRHILLPSADDAQEAIRKLRSGAKFPALAQKLSLDAETAAEGGKMRPAIFGEMIGELEELFRMKTGELGGPVRSKFGYHVLLKEGSKPLSLEEAGPRIRGILEKQKLDRHLQALQSTHRVEVVDAQFK